MDLERRTRSRGFLERQFEFRAAPNSHCYNATNLPPTFSHLPNTSPQLRATKFHPINCFIPEETWLHIPTLSLIPSQTHTLTPTIQVQVQVQAQVREVDRQARVLFSNYAVRMTQILAQCPRQ